MTVAPANPQKTPFPYVQELGWRKSLPMNFWRRQGRFSPIQWIPFPAYGSLKSITSTQHPISEAVSRKAWKGGSESAPAHGVTVGRAKARIIGHPWSSADSDPPLHAFYPRYFNSTKPPMSSTATATKHHSRYLSMKGRIRVPKRRISQAMRRNRRPLPRTHAPMANGRL